MIRLLANRRGDFTLEKKRDCATVGPMKPITLLRHWVVILIVVLALVEAAWGQSPPGSDGLTLLKAVMCESIQGYEPVNPAVVFSIELGRVSCFTEFDQISAQTFIHHKWYRKDSLINVKRLTINPPRWSSFTSVQLRDADKGPWRVEITDENDRLMRTLRFSITD